MHDILQHHRIMPVLTLDTPDTAMRVGEALLAGGITIAEVTLRTPHALAALTVLAKHYPALYVGAGTVLTGVQAQQAGDAGARFAVSPGTTDALIEGCRTARLPLLPGAASVSEMMRLYEQGFQVLKFFPAHAAGGMAFLQSLHSPLPSLQFCPTGGITQDNAPHWLALDNVICVGGTWIAPQSALDAGDFATITQNARQAAKL